jgi:ParB/RepB/Spo0J family partition protein
MSTATAEKLNEYDNPQGYDVHLIQLDEIFLDEEFNCRGGIAPIDVIDLARDIKDRKLDTPITVQPYVNPARPDKKYRIVAGHRRYTAFEVNRLDPEVGYKYEKIPCFIDNNLNEMQARTLNLRENLHRKQLNILQEAKALKFYFDARLTDADIADVIGMSPPWVSVRKALLNLPSDIQEVAAAGMMTQQQIKHAATLVKNKEKLYAFVRKLKETRENGERLDLTPSIKRSNDALKKRERKGSEIREMKELIYDVFGPCLATRFGAWADGTISTVELNNTILEEARNQGKQYTTPAWINKALVGDRSKDEA